MTLLIGIRCRDGVVMASDSAATFTTGESPTIGQQNVTKVHRLNNAVLYGSTGAIGVSQLVAETITNMWTSNKLSSVKQPGEAMSRIGTEIASKIVPHLQSAGHAVPLLGPRRAGEPLLCKHLVALPVNKIPCLFQFSETGAPEHATAELPFVALGSGQGMADPFLAFLKNILWADHEPTVAEGRFVAAWALQHVVRVVPGFVGGQLQMATLIVTNSGPRIDQMDDSGRQERLQAIEAAESALRDHVRRPSAATGANDVPRPGDGDNPGTDTASS